MQRGFVTIATGDERYYRMARTLLRSYRQTCDDPMRFALIADRENEYTAEFDDVVILQNPANSWMDKLALLEKCPYTENIFIDADCTIYQDINLFWDLFSGGDDFSCFGSALPLDANYGWFTAQAAEIYPIKFITHLHGICYFIRPSDTVLKLRELCADIMQNYDRIQFSSFNDKMADEPIFALAMAVLNVHPVHALPEYYGFAPCTTKLQADYLSRTATYETPWHKEVSNGMIIHWSNILTDKALYRVERHKINYCNDKHYSKLWEWLIYHCNTLFLAYKIQDVVSRSVFLAKRLWAKLISTN